MQEQVEVLSIYKIARAIKIVYDKKDFINFHEIINEKRTFQLLFSKYQSKIKKARFIGLDNVMLEFEGSDVNDADYSVRFNCNTDLSQIDYSLNIFDDQIGLLEYTISELESDVELIYKKWCSPPDILKTELARNKELEERNNWYNSVIEQINILKTALARYKELEEQKAANSSGCIKK